MPILLPASDFALGPDHPTDKLPKPLNPLWRVLIRLFLVAFSVGFVLVQDAPQSVATTPGFLFAMAFLVIGWMLGGVLGVFSGASGASFWPALPLVVMTGVALNSEWICPPDATRLGLTSREFQAMLLVLIMGMGGGWLMLQFLRQATLRGARLIQARWRSRREVTWLLITALFAALLLALHYIQYITLTSDPVSATQLVATYLFFVALPVLLYVIFQRAVGSAGLAMLASIFWLLFVSWKGLALAQGLADLLAPLLFLGVMLAYYHRRPIETTLCVLGCLVLSPESAFLFICLGFVIMMAQRDAVWGLALMNLGLIVLIGRYALYLGGITPTLPSEFTFFYELIAAGTPNLFVNFALDRFYGMLLLLLLPLHFTLHCPLAFMTAVGVIFLDAIGLWGNLYAIPRSTPELFLHPMTLSYLAAMVAMTLPRCVYQITLLPLPIRTAFDLVQSSPEQPPAIQSDRKQRIPGFTGTKIHVVPRPWKVDHLLRLRAAAGIFLFASLTLLATQLGLLHLFPL